MLVACDEPEPTPTPEECEDNPNIPGCQEKNCKTNPEMEGCQELPNTGPLEIVLAIIIIAGLSGGGYYLYRSRRTLKTVEKNVSGKDVKQSDTKQEIANQDNAKSENKTDKKAKPTLE